MTDVHHAAIPGIVNRRDFLTLAAATAILTMGGRPSNAQDASAAAAPPSIKPTPVGNISPENFLAAHGAQPIWRPKCPCRKK